MEPRLMDTARRGKRLAVGVLVLDLVLVLIAVIVLLGAWAWLASGNAWFSRIS